MRLARWGLVLVAIPGVVALVRGDDSVERSPSRSMGVAGPRGLDFRGAGSCSAVACHGSIAAVDPELSNVLRNEHTTWVAHDAHSRAYQVLFGTRSARIVANLARDRAHVTPAEQDVRCLACHTVPRMTSELAETSWLNQDGVGCESCHGRSGRWLGPHTTESWRTLPKADKGAMGFLDNKELGSRARLCAGCHVGEGGSADRPARDVNHDLIAAGHPRLNFELAAFLDNMPSHWVEKGENGRGGAANSEPQRAADFPARVWAIGRIATAEQALALLRARAGESAERHGPWPEFAELDCFSCHHDLRDQTWRRAGRKATSLVGSPRWGSWNTAGIDEIIAEFVGDPIKGRYDDAASVLAREMAKPDPDAQVVINESKRVADLVGACREKLRSRRLDAAEVQRLIERIDRPDHWERISSWDEATQTYLGLVPLRQSLVELRPSGRADRDSLGTRLEVLRAKLSYPPGFDSPKGFDPTGLPKPTQR